MARAIAIATTKRLRGARVLVAGAGLAGLAAAERLENAGADVTIVEARDRVGGRVWTLREGFEHGQHAEAGADIIEDEQTAVVELAKRLGLRLARTLRRGFAYYGAAPGGRAKMQTGRRAFDAIATHVETLVDEYKLADSRWSSGIAHRLANESVADWMRAKRLPPWVRGRIEALRGLFLADTEELSMLALVDFLTEVPSSGQADGVLRVVGGNDQLATKLADRLRTRVELRTTLRAVWQTKTGVRAVVECNGRRAEWRGHFLVVAMPASTVRDVAFHPALPSSQAKAIRALQYGRATRALIQFDRRYWRREGRPLAFATALPCGALWDGNEEQRGRAGILSFLAGGRSSESLSGLLINDGPEGVLRHIRWLGAPSRVLHVKVVRWEHDPLARGGYAYFDPAFDPRWRDVLAQPAGRVMFAGEHTSIRWQGYMNGAVESGQRAAAEIEASRT